MGEGRELRTEHGRAEVLLTPGVFLRIAENSSVRMLSNKLSDTRVELLSGSAILESTEEATDTPNVRLAFKNWQVRLAKQGAYRIDSDPAGLHVYKGEIEVSTDADAGKVAVKEGEALPLAGVLVPEKSAAADVDLFKSWAMGRSQAVAADNAIAAEIVDNPNQVDSSGVDLAAFSSFPATGIPSLGITNPYGLSFWSPYQSLYPSGLGLIYFPSYLYGGAYSAAGWPAGIRSLRSTSLRPLPGQMIMPSRIGIMAPVGVTAPRSPVGIAGPRPPATFAAPRGPMPHVGGGVRAAPAHR